MKKKISFIGCFIIIVINILSSVALANTVVKEAVEVTLENIDKYSNYRIEIYDSTNKKIIIVVDNMKIKESYIEKDNNILDLKENSRIEYLESDNKYNVYIEYITDINYQLDYNNPYKYYIYVDDELQTEVERTLDYVDRMRSDEDRKCYTFRAFYNKRGEIFYKACIYGIHSFYIYFILIIIFCMYMSLYGKRKKAGMLCGGIVKEEDVNLNREDFEKFELEKAYASLYYCTQISTKKLKNGIIGAYILKWYKYNK